MAVAPMQKVAIVTLKEYINSILEVTQKKGIFEVIQKKSDAEFLLPEYKGIEGKIANIEFAIQTLLPYSPSPENFRQKILGNKIESSEENALEAMKKDFSAVVEECTQLEEKRNKVKTEKNKICEKKRSLESWKAFDLPLNFERKSKNTHVFLGSVETKDFFDLENEIEDFYLTDVHIITQTSQNTFFFLVVEKSIFVQIKQILEAYRYTEMKFEGVTGTVSEEIERLEAVERELSAEELELAESSRKLAKNNLKNLKLAHDALVWMQERKETTEKSMGTEKTVYMEGWVPKDTFAQWKKNVLKVTKYVEIKKVKEEGDVPPTLLQNNAAVKPVEGITSLFGSVSHNEIDPTAIMAPFFIIFFGFCLSDAGYGILLALTSLAVIKFFPITKEVRTSMYLLLYCGLSTIIMGVLFGGYFGMTPEQFPILAHPENGLFYGQVFDPMKDLVGKIMIFAYGLGILQLLLGVFISGLNYMRKEKYFAAYLGSFNFIFTAGLIGYYFYLQETGDLLGISEYLGYGIIALLILFSVAMLREKNPVLFIFDDVLSWISNVLSYSRLFALGLASAVIAIVFNSLAGMVAESMMPILGIPLAIIVLLVGHTLNIALGMLGAFVHSLRLQFVEFFGKFLEGEGRSFLPLSRKRKYIFIAE